MLRFYLGMKQHRKPRALDQVPATSEVAQTIQKKDRNRRLLKWGGAVAGAAAVGAILAGSDFHASKDIGQTGFTLHPNVNAAQTENLININDGLNEYSKYIIGGEIVALGALGIATSGNRKWEATEKFSGQGKRTATFLLATGIVGAASSALAIGNMAANNSAEVINGAAQATGSTEATPVITGYGGAFGNHMPVNAQAVDEAVIKAGGVPINLVGELGKVEDPKAAHNPTAGPIVGIPEQVLAQSMGVNLPPVENCDDMSVLVGEQLFTKDELDRINSHDGTVNVNVNGRKAHVAGTVPVKPGLGRVIAIGSTEQISKCLYPESEMVIAENLTVDQVRQEVLPRVNAQLDTAYVGRSFADIVKENQDFWDGSVKPSEMNLVMDQLVLGGIGIGFMEYMQLAGRRKKIAVRLSRDVSKARIAAGEFVESQKTVMKSLIPGFGAYAFFAYNISSSTWGITQSVTVDSLAAGGLITAAGAGLATSISSLAILRNINPNEETRGNA